MQKITKVSTFVTALFLSTSVLADPVSIPNTFARGMPAVAADVNENFAVVEDGVNTNADSIMSVQDQLMVLDGKVADNKTAIDSNNALIGDMVTNQLPILVSTEVDNILSPVVGTITRDIGINADNIQLNFEAIDGLPAAVDANTAAIAAIPPAPLQVVMVDGNGTTVGTVLNMDFTTFGVISNKKYAYLNVSFSTGRTNKQQFIWYESFDCTGQPYTNLPNGMVFDAYPSTDLHLYYVHHQAIPVALGLRTHSQLDATGCNPTTNLTYRPLVKALQNDPNVTGIPNSDYPSPITIDRR